jgi:hypothetical protein
MEDALSTSQSNNEQDYRIAEAVRQEELSGRLSNEPGRAMTGIDHRGQN